MIGMSFLSFLTLLVLGLISSVVLHSLFRYRILSGGDGFLSQWIAGYIGGWLGSPVFGHWGVQFGGIHLGPAVLGAFVAPFIVTAMFKASVLAVAPRSGVTVSGVDAASPFAMRKAS
jgi:uncharacterized membrane protein YeaQ/YmgE (transglycosylase-associated protein family)